MDEWEQKIKGPGYEHPSSGVFVPEDKLFNYALEQIEYAGKEGKQDFVEWFYRRWYWIDADD